MPLERMHQVQAILRESLRNNLSLNTIHQIQNYSEVQAEFASPVPQSRGVSSANSTHPAWADSSQYDSCGQSCLYQKGNENISLQALYLVKKITNMSAILQGNETGSDNPNAAAVLNELQSDYCPEEDKTDTAAASRCLKRYIQTQLPVLRSIRSSLAKNEDMQGQLLAAPGGRGTFSVLQDSKAPSKRPQTPSFAKEDELLTTDEGQKHLQMLASEQYQNWVSDIQRNAPNPKDFVLTTEVPRDPTDPKSEKITRIVRDGRGNPVPDGKAYAKAKLDYDNGVKGINGGTGLANHNGMDAVMKSDAFKQLQKNKTNLDFQDNTVAYTKAKQPVLTKIDDVAFREARNQAVQVTTEMLGKKGVLGTVSYQPNRSTASTTDSINAASNPLSDSISNSASNRSGRPSVQNTLAKNSSLQAQLNSHQSAYVTPASAQNREVGAAGVLKPVKELDNPQALSVAGQTGDYTVSYSSKDLGSHIDAIEDLASKLDLLGH